MKKIPLHTRIILGILAGILWGLLSKFLDLDPEFTLFYIKPAGTIFIRLLLMIALPLVFISLVIGVAQLGDISKFSRMGAKTIGVYLLTTCIAVSVGLLLGNVIKPGKTISEKTRAGFEQKLKDQAKDKIETAEQNVVRKEGPLQPIIDIVPKNIVGAASENTNMLQIVFFALLLGIALLKIPKHQSQQVIAIFEGLNQAIIVIIDFIMVFAPLGVFGLIASFIVETTDPDLIFGVLWYALTVMTGLALMIFGVYPLLLSFFSKIKYKNFFKGIRPAMLLAFSTSSSSATLPVTIKNCEENLGLHEDVTGFVLPLGATINMDGTSLYQGVAAVFIAQVFNMGLSLGDQLTILTTALLASIGTAGVPGAGMVMLIIVLRSVGIPVEGIVLILAPDRFLDMCRTVVNVTGDTTVASIVSGTEQNRPDRY